MPAGIFGEVNGRAGGRRFDLLYRERKGGCVRLLRPRAHGQGRQRHHGSVTGSPAAERMRLHRERRRRGLRCLMIELRETEIDALIRKGFLTAETRNDAKPVRKALYAFLDRTLGAMP